jgi:Vacuolar protein sorting-associated protein 62
MAAEHEDLLQKHRPQLMYDSLEAYFADDPAQMVVNPGNVLRRGDQVLARVDDGSLTRDTLTSAGQKDDCLSIAGKEYAKQYAKLRQEHPDLNNVIVARAKPDRHGKLWLQYWLWYFYNDYRLTADVGLHEGDWEMVQLRLTADGAPDYAVYNQHSKAQRRPWGEVETVDGRPVVYVARGSHASYYERGVHRTEVWADVCDGKRPAPELRLHVLSEDDAPRDWSGWPGRWGDTRPARPELAQIGQAYSPDGPCRKKQWKDPARLLEDAYEEPSRAKSALVGAGFDVGRQDGHLTIAYTLLRPGAVTDMIAVNVNSAEEPGVPPKTFTVRLDANVKRATVLTDVPVAPDRTYDVRLSMEIRTRAGATLPSITVARTLDPDDHVPKRKVTAALGTLLVPITEWLKRLFRRHRP